MKKREKNDIFFNYSTARTRRVVPGPTRYGERGNGKILLRALNVAS